MKVYILWRESWDVIPEEKPFTGYVFSNPWKAIERALNYVKDDVDDGSRDANEYFELKEKLKRKDKSIFKDLYNWYDFFICETEVE